MAYKTAQIFSNESEYEFFRYHYCDDNCKFLGKCPIEERCELAQFDEDLFPNVLVEVWEQGKCVKSHHCPFYTEKKVE